MQHTPGLLQPLLIPSHHFKSWSLDLITDLPLSHGCNAILYCVNCLTKLCWLTPCFMGVLQLGTGEVAQHFFDSVIRHYGVPSPVVHDQDPQLTSAFL